MTRISIVILTYNHEKFIGQNLAGIFSQAVDAAVEVIICDDHSQDQTDSEITKSLENISDGFNVKYIRHSKNMGATPNFYFALEQVTGDFVAFCEGDDYWTDPHKLQHQLDFLKNNPDYSMCFHAAQNIADDPAVNGTLFSDIETRDYSQLEIYRHWIVHTATVMMRSEVLRSAAKKATMKDQSLQYFDTVLFLAARSVGKVHGFEKVMSAYRRHDAGLSAGKVNYKRDLKHNKLDAVIGKYYKGDISKFSDWQIFTRSYRNFKSLLSESKWKTALQYLPWLLRNRTIVYYFLKNR
ncbi:putative glycosyl transferase [Flavobacteriaceae bacterium 3519-10]|nr:putative glycosyl transferase [Flavobacteriaceae bacterium 3519-10]